VGGAGDGGEFIAFRLKGGRVLAGMTVEDLERWEQSGAHWQVVSLTEERLVLDMLACTGELVERRWVDDPEVIGWVRARQAPGPE
jgi:hypothetical protein